MMRRVMGPTCAALVSMFLGATAARADLTAEEVWQGLLDYYSDAGATVTTEAKAMAGDTLVISGAVFASGEGDARFDLRVPELRLRETGDGRVEMSMAEKITGRFGSAPGASSTSSTAIEISQSDLVVVVSGNAGDRTYTYDAPKVVISGADTKASDKGLPPSFSITMEGGSGQTRTLGTATRVSDSNSTFQTVGFKIVKPAAEAGAAGLSMSGSFNEVAAVAGLQLPDSVDFNDMDKAFAAGYRVEGRVQFASGNINIDMADKGETTNVQVGITGGQASTSLSSAGIATAIGTGASRAVIQIPSIPVPGEIGLDAMSLSISFPGNSDGVGPFTIAQRIDGLSLSNGIWAMFDPASVLPHDPMAFALDLGGTMKFEGGLFAHRPAGAADAVPAAFETLLLNEMKLSALGTEVSGKGSARIVNDGPNPRPIGAAEFDLNGLSGLLDKLVAMNLMQQDQAMGMRMMMAMFTVPTGEDSAKSRIEADEGGDVRVNGQVLYKFPKP